MIAPARFTDTGLGAEDLATLSSIWQEIGKMCPGFRWGLEPDEKAAQAVAAVLERYQRENPEAYSRTAAVLRAQYGDGGTGTGGTSPTNGATPPSATGPNGDAGAAAQEGRGAKGRFVAGNRFGRGNPFSRRQAKLREALLESATEGRVKELIEKLHAQALAGDTAAARLWLEYTVGKPTAAVSPDLLDSQEVALLRGGLPADELQRVHLNPAFAAAFLRLVAPAGAAALANVLEQEGRANIASYLAVAAGLQREGES
jgi:hypothetical protein